MATVMVQSCARVDLEGWLSNSRLRWMVDLPNLSSLKKMATVMVQSCARVDLEGSLSNSGLYWMVDASGLEDPDICAIVGSHYKQCLGHINYKQP
jgi:hypothetical protein